MDKKDHRIIGGLCKPICKRLDIPVEDVESPTTNSDYTIILDTNDFEFHRNLNEQVCRAR